MPLDGSVTASVTVTNTGSCAGDEIVQLYIHDIYATSTRPVKELKGFRKVHLEPGASAQVDFTLTQDDLSYYNHDLQWAMRDFVAIDFETANECPSSVCSVGIVVVRGGEIVDRFYSLIHPEPEYYQWFCRQVHGLGPEDTEDATGVAGRRMGCPFHQFIDPLQYGKLLYAVQPDAGTGYPH